MTGFNRNDEIAKLVAKHILEILYEQNSSVRKAVCDEIKYNPIFCTRCGYGSQEDPNPHCPCENDE